MTTISLSGARAKSRLQAYDGDVMMARTLIGGCLFAVLMLHPGGAAAQTASTPDQNANTGNDLFRPPANLFQMMDEYKTAPGSGSTPGSTRDVTTETLSLRMDHSLDLAPMWILALRADLPLLAKKPDHVGQSRWRLRQRCR